VITIFCFELRKGPGTNCYELFLHEMERMRRAMALQMTTFEVSYGNPHVAAVFSASGGIIERIAPGIGDAADSLTTPRFPPEAGVGRLVA